MEELQVLLGFWGFFLHKLNKKSKLKLELCQKTELLLL